VTDFKCVRTVTNQNCIHEEIKRRLKSGNDCCHAVQNLSSSRLLSKDLKMKMYKTLISYVVLYGCEPWSLTLRKIHELRVSEKRLLSKICEPKRGNGGRLEKTK
jgi:hypothetical protein